MEHNKVSVVTVSYRAEKYIKRVMDSVLVQSYRPLEYIVIDGGSTDGTVKILMDYEKEFYDNGIDFAYVSEPDKGIYDAMNKALKYCNGEWVIYLGADDNFASSEILEKIFLKEYHKEIGVLYGDVILENDGVQYYRKADSIDTLQYKMPFCHQAVLTRKNLLLYYQFDDRYTAFGDMDIYMRMYADAVNFAYVDNCISVFRVGGSSFKNRKVLQREYKRAILQVHASFLYRVKKLLYYYLVIPTKCNQVIYRFRLFFLRNKKRGSHGK